MLGSPSFPLHGNKNPLVQPGRMIGVWSAALGVLPQGVLIPAASREASAGVERLPCAVPWQGRAWLRAGPGWADHRVFPSEASLCSGGCSAVVCARFDPTNVPRHG